MHLFYITGTSQGLGRALAQMLLEDENNRVVGMARSCTIDHPRYEHLTMDLTSTEAIEGIHWDLLTNTQRVVLVNNAGAIQPIAHVGDLYRGAIQANLDLNLTAPIALMNAFIQATADFAGRRIILNISSGAARHPIESWGPYCAAKAGLDMFSQVIATEQALEGVQNPVAVFSVAPGVVDTAMQARIRNTPETVFSDVERFKRMQSQGELWPPERVAAALMKIISNPEAYPNVRLDVRSLPQ
jgi:benzil reductase ((S)-benzoin forming)